MTDEEIRAAEAAAEKAAQDAAAAAAEEAAKKNKEGEGKDAKDGKEGDGKPSDAEARLLRDMMKQKAAAKAASEELEAAKQKLREFDGVDPAIMKTLLAEKKEAERKEAEKRGEYDRIIAQVRAEADARVAAAETASQNTQKALLEANQKIDELTIGSSFRGSKFVTNDTVLSGDKARRLYGDHFSIEDGVVVAYDKPKGASDRTPLVDAKTGANLDFEAAIEKIIKADPDFETIARSKMKAGSGSPPPGGFNANEGDKKVVGVSGRERIAQALRNKTTRK